MVVLCSQSLLVGMYLALIGMCLVQVGKIAYCEANWLDYSANEDELAAIFGESKVNTR